MTRDDQVLSTPRRLAPGLALATLAVGAAVAAWRLQPSVSPLLTGLLIGALLANLPRLPAGLWRAADPGLRFASKRLLRIGIVLLGLQLVLEEIVALGIGLIVSAVFIVAASMLSILYIGGRIGISLRMRILIASGFSICGAAAVAAVGDVVKGDEEDVAVSLGLVVLFGSIMIPVIPLAGMLLGMPDVQIAVWAGGSILEVAQVVAAAGAVGTGLLATAVLVKLSRVLMLAPVVITISAVQRRGAGSNPGARPAPIPLFVAGFLCAVLVRSTLDIPQPWLEGAAWLQVILMSAAMFALGCGVRLGNLRGVGWKPLLLGCCAVASVSVYALSSVMVVAA